MEGSKVGLFVLRILQLISACVVLGLSVDMVHYIDTPAFDYYCEVFEDRNHCDKLGLPTTMEFGAFVGAWGLIDSLMGLTAIFASAIPYVAIHILDGLAFVFYLAGAIDLTVWISKYNLSCPKGASKCTEIKADTAFLWIGFITTVVVILLGFLWQRRSGKYSR